MASVACHFPWPGSRCQGQRVIAAKKVEQVAGMRPRSTTGEAGRGWGVQGSEGVRQGLANPAEDTSPLGTPWAQSLSPESVESRVVDEGRGSWEACLGDGIHFPVATMCEMKIG